MNRYDIMEQAYKAGITVPEYDAYVSSKTTEAQIEYKRQIKEFLEKKNSQLDQADHAVEKLINRFGGIDKWLKLRQEIISFGEKELSKEEYEDLTQTYEGVLSMYEMMVHKPKNLLNSHPPPAS